MQMRLDLQKMLYFTHPAAFIMALSKTGECQRFGFKGESEFLNYDSDGCQVGQNRFLQVLYDKQIFRILKIDPTQKCLSIERYGQLPICCDIRHGLTNFRNKFVFLNLGRVYYRYSLTEHKWEELPRIPSENHLSACSLGDKVYVLDLEKRAINVLHNPDAPVSSKEMHWQEIGVPGDVPIPR